MKDIERRGFCKGAVAAAFCAGCVSRSSKNVAFSFTEQMAEGFKAAIARGVYRPDEVLPGILELADAAGVSAKVPRTALGVSRRKGG